MLEQEKEGGCTGGGQLFDTLELEREFVVLLLDFRVQQLSEQEMKCGVPGHRASHEAGVVLHISSSSSTMPAASSKWGMVSYRALQIVCISLW
jgi:hypothetical protein